MSKVSRVKSALQSLLNGEISNEEFTIALYDIDNMLFKCSSVCNAIWNGNTNSENCFILYKEYMEFLE